ncbi:hypothetical protein GPECTOR_1514g689 [Gonium pectorale]|uniref:Uncharacterized protein n=1 Tax=Gonium pectorale TaxID=33097 RepID=A0A150FTD6_GONPE|nr:hypothetical protein GPECTOR_1514g689 [Gonium pectorale]|eukprot:KXZ40887.1 hypothetical protein GPECTOR_1514g689 [Gonium pectorale]
MYDLAVRQARDGFLWEHGFVDIHPGNQAHKFMADLAVWTLQSTALGLLQLPYNEEDEQVVAAPLPDPMYQGNVPPNSTMCLMGDMFRSLALPSSSGFSYVNEGTAEKPKPGYVATQPGAVLALQLSTDRSGISKPGDKINVFFHYLRSYEHMGVARFR